MKKKLRHKLAHPVILSCVSAFLILVGAAALWIGSLKMPDLSSLGDIQNNQSTKIYDRTGTILLFDTGSNTKRTEVALADISPYIQNASIAIEDSSFYTNIGIDPLSILRAFFADIFSGGLNQGASTITQQVIKNALLSQDKTFSRKIEEWVLAIKLTRSMSKDDILNTYLNSTPYGGTIYGVEAASQEFFGVPAKDVTLAEAAYLAAIPQAPTFYSPSGPNRAALDTRHVLVLNRMKDLGMITESQYTQAIQEKVTFLSGDTGGIRAPHFVMYVISYLTQKYGEAMVDQGGLKVITTLDYGMQQIAENTITKFGPTLSTNFDASNTAMVAINPQNGDILTMVGSRNYFDPSIDGNFNVALAKRQPGSTFKPFVYATAFKEGYTPETELFDVPIQFSTACTPDGKVINPADSTTTTCYSPGEYDGVFEGPISMRAALAQSRNLPAVETLYLAGIPASIQTAQDLGITTLTDPTRYGLTLVLGGGEVTLLDLTSAYGVFADDGIRNPYRSILSVIDSHGNTLEEAATSSTQVLDPDIAHQISSILSDNTVRMTSIKPIADSVGREVAIKTGTTNDYRDVWTLGYTPNLVLGAWAGNDDDSPMSQNVAGLIITPVWGAVMSQIVKGLPVESFKSPPPPLTDGKPVLRGIWQGGISYWKDSVSGKLATQYTPAADKEEVIFNSVHSILQWVNKSDPRGPIPTDPTTDPQYANWEYGVRNWFTTYQQTHPDFHEVASSSIVIPTETDDVHIPQNFPHVTILSPSNGAAVNANNLLTVHLNSVGTYTPQKTDVYVNGRYVLTSSSDPLNFSFIPSDVGNLSSTTPNTLSVTLYDSVLNTGQATSTFFINQ